MNFDCCFLESICCKIFIIAYDGDEVNYPSLKPQFYVESIKKAVMKDVLTALCLYFSNGTFFSKFW
jgi:hypothetical protein